MLTEQMQAPEFKLMGADGKEYSLSECKGNRVVLYFYPKDDTPGCTTEACDFRDNIEDIKAHKAIVFGISKDGIASHQKFIAKHALNFTLLSDPNLEAYQAYGALESGKTIRNTYLIDEAGKVVKIWPKVQVKGHVAKVLEAIKALFF
jgi:peroxiredoxin Q/BCP